MKVPPKILTWVLDLCCPRSRPDLKGDFLELYNIRAEESGRLNAIKKFIRDLLSVMLLRFIIKESSNPKPSISMLPTNLKIARRNLSRNKIYTGINLVGLSISITACILITLFVRDELSFDKHFKDGDRIYRIAGSYAQGGPDRNRAANTSYMLQPMLVGNLRGFDHMTRVSFASEMITLEGNKQFLESAIIYADSTFFDVFALPFEGGDPATALDDPAGVVLDRPTAEKYFGTVNAIGKSIEMKGKQFTVTGVMKEFPANTHFMGHIIFPMSGVHQWLADWVKTNFSGTSLYTYFKSNNEFSLPMFAKSLNKIAATHWEGDNPPDYFLQPLTSIHLKSNLSGEIAVNGSEGTVYIFSVTAFVILVMACINYINLTTAGSLRRGKEVGMKRILGSTSGMQVAQFQTESFLVVILSTIPALVFTKLFMPFFNQLSGKTLEFNIFNDSLIGFGVLIAVVTISFIAGSFPALILLKMNTMSMLSGKLEFKGSKSYFRNSLIIFQFAISITLIASTLVVIDQISFIRQKDLGIDTEQLVMIPFQTFEISNRYDLIKTEMLRNPDVLGIAASNEKVTGGVTTWRGYVSNGAKEAVTIPTVTVSHDFFETMGAKILEGRSFSPEYKTDYLEAYILNESAAKFLDLDNPVGTPLFGYAFTGSVWSEKNARVIGVVKDFHLASLHTKVAPVVFSLASEIAEPLNWIEVRISSNNVRETIESLKQVWTRIAPERPFQFEFMDEDLQQQYKAEDRFLKIFISFSVLSVVLGGLGLLGLTAFMAKRRTKEIGIRKVLGASTLKLISILSIDFLKLVVIANVIGWPIAYYLMNNWLKNFAYQTTISLWIFIGTGLAALIIALMAILYHSLKVSRANPVRALRYE